MARIAAGVGAVAGVGYYIRVRGVKGEPVNPTTIKRDAKAALGSVDDKGMADTIKGAYGGSTGGATSGGQRKV